MCFNCSILIAFYTDSCECAICKGLNANRIFVFHGFSDVFKFLENTSVSTIASGSLFQLFCLHPRDHFMLENNFFPLFLSLKTKVEFTAVSLACFLTRF